ncbi:MAG: hypothetical protein GDA68_16360 [Nitrospira sp. CR2.1]|nr:hypothetical protein [Nitrospira sp. CR2.1]
MLPFTTRPDYFFHSRFPLWQVCVAIVSVCMAFTLLACDPEDLINEYFRQMGLSRLAVLRMDIQPGTLILMKGQEAFLGDHILDYVEQAVDPSHEYGAFGGSAKDEVDAVLRTLSSKTELSGKATMSFLVSLFQLRPSLDLGLTGTVSIALPDAKVRKMKVASLEKFLSRTDSTMFQKKVREWLQQGITPFVAYEVYRAKSLKMLSAEGTDVAPSLKANAFTPLPVEGAVQVAYKKTAANELILAGNRYYAFAVRTAKLSVNSDERVTVDQTSFVKPEAWGIKSVGTDDQYTAPLRTRFEPVTLQGGLPPDF